MEEHEDIWKVVKATYDAITEEGRSLKVESEIDDDESCTSACKSSFNRINLVHTPSQDMTINVSRDFNQFLFTDATVNFILTRQENGRFVKKELMQIPAMRVLISQEDPEGGFYIIYSDSYLKCSTEIGVAHTEKEHGSIKYDREVDISTI